jgi:hypothetical protein
MPNNYRKPSTKILPPPPPEFAENFIKGGWRLVERLYGARTDLLLKWIELSGGEDLHARRRAAMSKTAVTSVARAGQAEP